MNIGCWFAPTTLSTVGFGFRRPCDGRGFGRDHSEDTPDRSRAACDDWCRLRSLPLLLRTNLNLSSALGRGASSVADLDAGPVPNPPILVPNGGASGPVACWRVDRSGRYIDGSWAGYRRSEQCTDCQTTNNASGYFTTPSSCSPGCTCEAN